MSTAATPQPATKRKKNLYYAEFTANLFDGESRRYSSMVLAYDRWGALDGLKARVGNKIRKIRIRKVQSETNLGGVSGASPILEV